MTRKFINVFIAVASVIIVSCNKENSDPQGTAANIQGSYTFMGAHIKTSTENSINEGGTIEKTTTTSEYDTKDNTGDFVIDDSKFSYTNLGYKVDAVAHSAQYENGTLQTTFDFPLQLTLDPQNGSAAYKVVTSDSLYFSSGSFISDGNTQITQPTGVKIKTDGNKLIITQAVSQTIKTIQEGENLTVVINATEVVTLQKK